MNEYTPFFEAKNFNRVKTFVEYKKEAVAAVKKAFKTLVSEKERSSTIMPKTERVDAPRRAFGTMNLMSQLQGILTREAQDLNIVIREGANSIVQVAYRDGDSGFSTVISIPKQRFNVREIGLIEARVNKWMTTSSLQDYASQDDIHYTRKSRKDRPEFGFTESRLTETSLHPATFAKEPFDVEFEDVADPDDMWLDDEFNPGNEDDLRSIGIHRDLDLESRKIYRSVYAEDMNSMLPQMQDAQDDKEDPEKKERENTAQPGDPAMSV